MQSGTSRRLAVSSQAQPWGYLIEKARFFNVSFGIPATLGRKRL